MVEQWKSDGRIVLVEQWNSDSETREQCWWNCGKGMVDHRGGTMEQ